MFAKISLLLWFSVLSSGCPEGSLDLQIKFEQINGLKNEDRVLFQENAIGRIAEVSYVKEGYFIADVEIKKKYKEAVTGHARFFIVADPEKEGGKAIEMLVVKGGGLPLKSGTVVKGSTRTSALLERMGEEFEKGMAIFDKKMGKFSEEMKSLSEKEEIQRLEKELEQLSKEMGEAVSAFREKMQKDVLPRIEKEIERLKEKLKKSGREKEVAPLEIQIDQMRKI